MNDLLDNNLLILENDLQKIYSKRFEKHRSYRTAVWRVINQFFFQKTIPGSAVVLDLGCGYGDFINSIKCAKKYAMDLNRDCPKFLSEDITFIKQDCSQAWELEDSCLDVVFTSNFFEHLADKSKLSNTLLEALRCLKPGGKLIAIGPNIKCLGGHYWDFCDHHIALTENSIAELLVNRGFIVERTVKKFLPYTLERKTPVPLIFVRLYLLIPFVWRIFGRQFLVVARKGD